MLKYIKAIDGDDANQTRDISHFFALFDAVVSEITQQVVSMLVDTENKAHLVNVARERMLMFALSSNGEQSGFMQLVGMVHQGECYDIAIAHQRNRVTPRAAPPIEYYSPRSALLSEAEASREWVKSGRVLTKDAKEFLIAMKNGEVVGFEDLDLKESTDAFNPSCKEIWGYIRDASKFIAARRLDPTAAYEHFTTIQDGQSILTPEQAAEAREVLDQAMEKVTGFSRAPDSGRSGRGSCQRSSCRNDL